MRSLAFVDLDLTLFDYTSARKEATCDALRALGVGEAAPELWSFAESTVIPHGHLIADRGLPDFRRAWMAPEFFAFLSVLDESPDAARDFARIRRYLAAVERSPASEEDSSDQFSVRWRHGRRMARNWHKTTLHSLLLRARERLETPSFQRRVPSALRAFHRRLREGSYVRPGADECLAALRQAGYEVYIVSEGDERIQEGKIDALDLRRRAGGVFISSTCARSEAILEWLWTAACERPAVRKAAGVVYNEVLQYSLKSPVFFRKVAHALLLPPEARTSFFGSFGWLDREECRLHEPVRILLLGDRYDKDLYPAMQAFGNVTSIRLRAGKYSDTDSAARLAAGNKPLPSATVSSLMEAAAAVRDLASAGDGAAALPAPPEPGRRVARVENAIRLLRTACRGSVAREIALLERLPAAMLGSR